MARYQDLSRATSTALMLAVVGVASCDRPGTTGPVTNHLSHAASAAVSEVRSANAVHMANEVRDMTAQYTRRGLAKENGYTPDPFCVAHPEFGGMGHHWVNMGLVDPVFQPRYPEVMLYAPDANGQLQLVAVEYIVIDIGQPAPTFGGQPFNVGGTPVPAPHWSLHVWLHKNNPNGMFAPFNPDVSCPSAPPT